MKRGFTTGDKNAEARSSVLPRLGESRESSGEMN